MPTKYYQQKQRKAPKKGCERHQNFAEEEKNKKRKKSLVKGIKVSLKKKKKASMLS